MKETVRIKVVKGNIKLTMDVPPENLDVATNALKALGEDKHPPIDISEEKCDEEEPEDDNFEDYMEEMKLSGVLKASPVYKKLKFRFKDYERAFSIHKIDIQDKVIEREKEIIAEGVPDWDAWTKVLRKIPFNPRQLKHYLVHVSGRISVNDSQCMADQVRNTMSLVPHTFIISSNKCERILVEIVAYGNDLVKRFGMRDHPW